MTSKPIKLHLFFIPLIIFLVAACQRSQFATTSRSYTKGSVTYTKTYHYEGRRSSKAITHKNRKISAERQSAAALVSKMELMPEITGITPVSEIQSENLVAATTTDPVFTVINEKKERSWISQRTARSDYLFPDTTVKNNQPQAGTNETLTADNRKIEKHGLTGFILSILGLFPILGFPLAILGLIFGIKSLHKIHRNPALYKGKGFAIASIILGVLGIIVSGVLIGIFISLSIWSHSGT